jgi:hypothetical protein
MPEELVSMQVQREPLEEPSVVAEIGYCTVWRVENEHSALSVR